jgi:hypothetical protein
VWVGGTVDWSVMAGGRPVLVVVWHLLLVEEEEEAMMWLH